MLLHPELGEGSRQSTARCRYGPASGPRHRDRLTSLSLNKFPIYVQLGVPEVWRYNGERLGIFRLVGAEYAEVAGSEALPSLTGAVISRFVEESKLLRRTVWMRQVRRWAREHGAGG